MTRTLHKVEEMEAKGYISVAAACKAASVSPGVIYRALATGKLEGTEFIGQKFVKRSALDEFRKLRPLNGTKHRPRSRSQRRR